MIIIQIILGFLLVLICLILLILITPFSYRLQGSNQEDIQGVFYLGYMFGIIRIKAEFINKKLHAKGYILGFEKELNAAMFNNEEKKSKNQKNKTKKIKKNKKKFEFGSITQEFIKEIFYLIRNIFVYLKPNEIKGYILLGTGNPFYDAMIDGFKYSVLSFFPKKELNFYQDYSNAILEGKITITGKIVPIKLILICISFIFKKPVRKIIFNKEEKNVT